MEFRVPELGEGVYEAELVAWLVKPGETVKRGQSLIEVLTDKATMEVPSPFAGKVTGLLAEPGQQIKVGDVVLSYQADGKPEEGDVPVQTATKPKAAAVHKNDAVRESGRKSHENGAMASVAVKAAPSVRYLARKLGVDLAGIRGTGPEGRVLLGDLSATLQTSTGSRSKPRPAFDVGVPGTRIKMQGVRRKIAEHMLHSKRTIPHYSYVDECDVTRLAQIRDDLKRPLAQTGIRLTYLAFFVRAVARALKEVPVVNSTLDESANEIVMHDHYHIGIAVAAPAGLVVPVIHDADRKDLTEIAREVDRLSGEARAGTIRLEDLRGSTFTVSSIGSIGGLISTPVINHPNVGIMGVGAISRRPVYDTSGNIRPADMLYLSFSFDHRVVDGALGAVFGNAVRQQLEHPAALLLK